MMNADLKKSTEKEDSALLSSMRVGDTRSFDTLFRKYYPVLCAFSHRIVGLEDAQEIVQDVMLWLWKNRESLFFEHSLKQYLFKAVYNRSLTRISQNESRTRTDAPYYERLMGALQDVDVSVVNELSRHINEAVAKLPPTYREAFVMHRFGELSYKEVAGLLGVSPKTVDYRIQQALKLLRAELRDYLPLLLVLGL